MPLQSIHSLEKWEMKNNRNGNKNKNGKTF